MIDLAGITENFSETRRLKRKLSKEFKKSNCDDVENAITLASYLVALNMMDQARSFLESFVYLDPEENDADVWVYNGHGLALLAYISRIQGDSNLQLKVAEILNQNDLWPVDIGVVRWVKMHLKDYPKIVSHATTESTRYKCEYLSQQFLAFLYFHEAIFEFRKPTLRESFLRNMIANTLKEARDLLSSSLSESL